MLNNNFKNLKRYGQNFLIDKNILQNIIDYAQIEDDDVVLEIGPGQGVLTRALLNRGVSCLHAVEIDERLRPELESLASENLNLKLHWSDAVKFNYAALEPFPNKVIANIPYNITTPLIWELLKFADKGLNKFIFMVQKEAADRIIAKADSKERYPLGVAIEAMGGAKILKSVSPECFKPVPKVKSALIEIKIDKNFELMRDNLFSRLLHIAFAHRRKTLLNNLKNFVSEPEQVLKDFKNLRAEDLSADDWIKIYEIIKLIGCPVAPVRLREYGHVLSSMSRSDRGVQLKI
ncbi:MAG: ribosomal RNA small subunit methyltransferase A [Synergistaceae bacterium]|nr:ribosomal RNA small subunit methyltransferase A [Synergistaceae bacterium]